jgi:hypothetical protein
MRSAMVYDYFNIYAHVSLDFIHKRRYKELENFLEHMLIALNSPNKIK